MAPYGSFVRGSGIIANVAGGGGPSCVVTPATSVPGTVLLLHGEGTDGSTVVEDSSPYSHGFTAFSGAEIDTAFSKFGTGSILLPGGAGRLESTAPEYALGSGAMTVDFWIRPTNIVGWTAWARMLQCGEFPAAGAWNFSRNASSNPVLPTFVLSDGAGAELTITAGNSLTTDAWNHVAVTRDVGGSWHLFVNGIRTAGTTNTRTLPSTTVVVGNMESAGNGSVGNIDEIRILDGTAVWTTDFTPNTDPYCDPVCVDDDVNMVLLVHMDGPDASTTFTDSSASAHTLTAQSTAQIDTAQSQFGGASGRFNGGGPYVSGPVSSDFHLQNDCTIDAWVYLDEAHGNVREIISYGGPGNTWNGTDGIEWRLVSWSDSRIYFQWWNGTTNNNLNTPVINISGGWHHVAVTGTFLSGSNSTWRIFLDGVQQASAIAGVPTQISSPNGLKIARAGADVNTWVGWIDEVHINNGTSLWQSDFTPLALPYCDA